MIPLLLASCGGGGENSSTSGGATTFSISWPNFPESALLGDSSEPLGDPNITPKPDSFTVIHKYENCQWDKQAKKILFENLGNCIIIVTATKKGIPTKTKEFKVLIVGEFISISWDSFPKSAAIGTPTGALS